MGMSCFVFDISAFLSFSLYFYYLSVALTAFLPIGSHFHKKFVIGVTVVTFITLKEVEMNFVL